MDRLKKSLFKREWIVLYILISLCILLSFLTKGFFTTTNAMIVLRQISTVGIMTLGMTFLIISGNIDLAAGASMALSGVIAATAMVTWHLPISLSILIALVCSVAVYTICGIIVAKGRIIAFIVTLGAVQIIRGVTMIWAGGMPIGNLPPAFLEIGAGFFLGIPIPVYIYAFIIALSVVFLRKTQLGRYIYAIGGNEAAAKYSGVQLDASKIKIFIIHGLLVGIAGIMLASRVRSGQPSIGQGAELDAISATIIGGTSFLGGVGTVFGAVVGTMILGVIANGLDLMGVQPFYQQIIKGAIIIVAVLIDRKRRI